MGILLFLRHAGRTARQLMKLFSKRPLPLWDFRRLWNSIDNFRAMSLSAVGWTREKEGEGEPAGGREKGSSPRFSLSSRAGSLSLSFYRAPSSLSFYRTLSLYLSHSTDTLSLSLSFYRHFLSISNLSHSTDTLSISLIRPTDSLSLSLRVGWTREKEGEREPTGGREKGSSPRFSLSSPVGSLSLYLSSLYLSHSTDYLSLSLSLCVSLSLPTLSLSPSLSLSLFLCVPLSLYCLSLSLSLSLSLCTSLTLLTLSLSRCMSLNSIDTLSRPVGSAIHRPDTAHPRPAPLLECTTGSDFGGLFVQSY